ncbi:MAG TPA: efflux RND transporter permease subunit [Planctomycetota bacterium]|jgi:HAE1 family hydrophobic/amphiphilic exporter-1
MSLSAPFVRRPAMTTLLTVSAILFGVLAYTKLAVNDLPAVDYPVIQVRVGYPGASPATMAANVATPLERQFMQINGLEMVTSTSTQGNTSFTLQFALSKSIDAAATDVQTAITQASGSLPVDLPSPPTFSKTNPNDQAILYIALTSDSVTAGKLHDYGNTQVAQRISILAGVSRVDVYGAKTAVRIKVDPSALATRGMTMDDLSKAINAGSTYQAAGQFDGPYRTFLLQPQGQLETAAQYSELIVAVKNGAPIYLRDVAEVLDSVSDERDTPHFWVRGVKIPAATGVLAVYRQAGANAVEVAASVRNVLPQISMSLPPGIKLTPIYDRSLTIVNSLKDVQETLLIAFVLVVAVIFAFLGRASDTLIPALALPLSLLLTFICMSVLGYSLDNLSLMALTLAIGFLVDDAIVFLENTVRRMEHGEEALQATLNSAGEISFTILAMTLSLASVFLPLVFMSGLIGRIFREFAVTIIVSIFASGLVSLTLTPLMCSRLLKNRGKHLKQTLTERLANSILSPIVSFYSRTLRWQLRHKWIAALIWMACMAGTIWLFITVPKTFLPIGDSSFIVGVLIGQEGSSPAQMRAYQEQADKILQANPATQVNFTLTGVTGFLPSNQCLILSFLYPREQRGPIPYVAGDLMQQLGAVQGTMSFLRPNPVLEISTGAVGKLQGQFSYALSGIDPEETYATANKMLSRLRQYEGFASVSSDLFNNTPNLEIDILRDQASSYGVSVSAIESLLRQSYSQNYIYLIKRPEDQYQVIMEVADKVRARPEDLDLLYVKSDDGKRMVPLKAVAKWRETLGPQSVNHLNQFTSVTLFFNIKPDVAVGDATAFVDQAAKEILPATIRGDLQGEAKDFQNTVKDLTLQMALAVFVMYVILGILYESYIHPITVLSSLPVALVGGLLTLHLFSAQASLYAFIGMFMLMGIVKKNGIMMIDFALQRLAEGRSSIDAIHEASINRFRPIIMTTLAALMGALPIALGYGSDGESRRPLGLLIVGGLVVSQLVTLYITPALYLYLEAFQEKVLDRTSFFRQHRVASDATPAPVTPEPVLKESDE